MIMQSHSEFFKNVFWKFVPFISWILRKNLEIFILVPVYKVIPWGNTPGKRFSGVLSFVYSLHPPI